MLKKEIIYREILTKKIEEKQTKFKQLSLSKKFKFSLSTVHNAIKPLAMMGAIDIKSRGFTLIDTKKALLYWATIRRLEKDITYKTRTEKSIIETEKNVPPTAIFTGYTGYKFLFKETPADYSETYFYLPKDDMEEVKLRYPPKKGPANLYVLTADKWLKEHQIAPTPQLFVDLWNMRTWYAGDFVNALEERIHI